MSISFQFPVYRKDITYGDLAQCCLIFILSSYIYRYVCVYCACDVTQYAVLGVVLNEFTWRLSQNCEKRLLASSCLSVRPSVRMEQIGSHWTDFRETSYLGSSENLSIKPVPWQSDKNSRFLTWRQTELHLWYLAQFYLEWEIFRPICRENRNTIYVQQLFSENRGVYEKM